MWYILIFLTITVLSCVMGVVAEDDKSIVSVETCKEIFAWDAVESYSPLSLPYHVYKRWPHLETIQKAVYLVERSHLLNLKSEYTKLQQAAKKKVHRVLKKPFGSGSAPEDDESIDLRISDTLVAVPLAVDEVIEEGDGTVTLDLLINQWHDFTALKTIEDLFKECDTNLDFEIDWVEYILCRCQYNQYGAPYDVSELDYQENILLYDFQQRLNDPDDPMTQELLARDEL